VLENGGPLYSEEQRKRDCIRVMNMTLMEKNKDQKSYESEATFYLEDNNYDLFKALDHFEADLKFERDEAKNKKKKKR
jgi:hypothetical protein